MKLRQREPRIKDTKHLRFVASLPCCVTGMEGQSQACHIRANTGGGMGLKPSDNFVVPLTWAEHSRQHQIGEVEYWGLRLHEVKNLANALYIKSGNREYALMLLERFKKQ